MQVEFDVPILARPEAVKGAAHRQAKILADQIAAHNETSRLIAELRGAVDRDRDRRARALLNGSAEPESESEKVKQELLVAESHAADLDRALVMATEALRVSVVTACKGWLADLEKQEQGMVKAYGAALAKFADAAAALEGLHGAKRWLQRVDHDMPGWPPTASLIADLGVGALTANRSVSDVIAALGKVTEPTKERVHVGPGFESSQAAKTKVISK